jgi:N-acetylglucosamine kinase-like BadF-type ATPase
MSQSFRRYFLGLDGGQSSTLAIIGDEAGRVLGMGRAGPCNHVATAEGKAKFVDAINGCTNAARAQAGLDSSGLRFASACLGFSGGPADKEALLREIIPSELMTLTHDALIALSGATARQPGLIAIAGTGSIAFGRNASGKTARAAGWGYMFGDEGSGFYITRQAVRAALRSEEGWGPSTSLRPALLEATGAPDVDQLVHRFYTPEFPRSRIAALSKLVDQAAENGDVTARNILNEAAQQLAIIAAAVRGQLFKPGEPARVSYVGGVFRSRILLERFRMLVEMEEGNQVLPPAYGPAAGALLEAYQAAGIRCTLSNVQEEKS